MREIINTAAFASDKNENSNGIQKKLLYRRNVREKVGEFVEKNSSL